MSAPITATQAQFAAAFDAWEKDYRADPANFLTAEETAAMGVATLSERRAITFTAYLRQGGAA